MRSRGIITALTVALAVLIVTGSALFSAFVHESLWRQSVTDVLEVAEQGRNALDTFFEKDLDTLDIFADELAGQSPEDLARIDDKIALFDQNDGDATYLCVDLASGNVLRSSKDGVAAVLTDDQAAQIAAQSDRGVLLPFLDEATGVKSIGVFEKFTFDDGTPGLVRKTRPLQNVADRYSLSFYEDNGFSYVVDASGDIVIRSTHRNSNRTVANIYDLVEGEGNDEETIASFRSALESGERGVALFSYLGTDYVFCYTPLTSAAEWDLVSIIPNDVVMKQANAVINATFALCAVIVASLLAVIVAYWRSSRRNRKRIEKMAFYDKLTNLYSSDKFEIEGNKMLSAARERRHREGPDAARSGMAAAYFNIADFKLINDVDGYREGDKVLRRVADIVREAAAADGIAGRPAADHFVMLYPYRTEEEAAIRCARVVERARALTGAGKPLALHAGVCCTEDAPDAATVNELNDRARIAKTEGRRLGKAVCVFNASMREEMLRRGELERAMESALATGEFFPLVQPKFSIDGTRVLGGEALVRWNRPGEGIVNPGEFIPLFEQNGFIVKLDEYMFECVCKHLRERLDAGLPTVPISVNVSRVHLHRSSFVPTYVRIKEAYRIPDELAELELTESMVLEDLDNAVSVIDDLRRAGFRCSIDDFGSGQSSLNALKELPADVLKLDRAFLVGDGRSCKEEVIVRAVIDMARKLDMKTVMEGVETEEQLDFIKTTSCDMIQGFVFSKPVPCAEFDLLLDETVDSA